METRTNWVIVGVAGAFALVAILVAVVAATPTEKKAPVEGGTIVASETSADLSAEWQKALAQIATPVVGPSGEYIAPKELPASQAMSQELFASYIKLKSDGTLTATEQKTAIADIIARNIKPIADANNYTFASFPSSASADLGAYAERLTEVLVRSTEIKEYELTSFARTVGANTTTGSPQLAKAATTYSNIERDLKTVQTPSGLATEHLAVLKSISMIAHVTDLMAGWSGDPLTALAYVDAFVKAERDVQTTINAVYRKIKSVAEKS